MTSVGKKFANFARGRNAKKKLPNRGLYTHITITSIYPWSFFFLRKRQEFFMLAYLTSESEDDDLDAELSFRKASLGGLSQSYSLSPGHSTVKSSKSNSLGSINSDVADPNFDQDDIISLTHQVRNFSDALAKLKTVLTSTEGVSGDDVRVSAHEQLGEVLYILKAVLQKYPALHNTDVLTSAAVLITKIKSCQYEDLPNDGEDLTSCVDQLALSFSSSVSEYLMGDIDNYPNLAKTKARSYDNLSTPMDEDLTTSSDSKEASGGSLSGEEIDRMLLRYESGVDIALQRAKAWAKYTKEIIIYVEKRAHMESEFAKNLQKHANNTRQIITEDSFLPFQSVYCMVLDQDIVFSSTTQATCVLIQSQKFIEPLTARRSEHEKIRKGIKEIWNRELRRMHEAVANVRKSKSLYITRQQEYEKAKETAQKAETDSLNQSTTGLATKLEKKKKLVDDILRKVAEIVKYVYGVHLFVLCVKALDAETSYKGCVAEANHRQQELEKVKGEVLSQLREVIHKSDQILKMVTVSYFQLLHTVAAPSPLQFQALWESSQHYEAGSQFTEYVKRLPIPSAEGSTVYEPFVFEPYNPDNKMHGPRKRSTQSSGSGCSESMAPSDYSPIPGRIGVEKSADDSDSDSDDSPPSSPYPSRKNAMMTSSSFGDLPVTTVGSAPDRLGVVSSEISMTFRGVILSQSARTHRFKKLRSPSKCRECETYVYFQGAECEKCGLSSHKKCLETLHWECGHRPMHRRMTTFGVDFSAHVLETHTDIPHLVQKCTAEVDSRGINIKGIYRISGVKSRVEKLCQSFETDEGNVDLSEQHPNVIANVLKLYLRQLPEPLLTFHLYQDLISLSKAEQQGTSGDILSRLTLLIHSLPVANFRTCGLLMHHLKREGAASFDSLLDTPHQTRVIELLILNVESIFGAEQIYLPRDESTVDQPDTSVSEPSANTLSPNVAEASQMRVAAPGGDSRWYVPPDFTEDLLNELAKEEPRFLQNPEETKPVVTIDLDLSDSADLSPSLHELSEAAFLTPVETSTPVHAMYDDVHASSDGEAAGATPASTEACSTNSSPGLRKRLLPSHVRPMSSAGSIFYTKEEDPKRGLPHLTKPTPFTPPLQRQMNTKRRHDRPPLKKPSSLDLPSPSGIDSCSSAECSPCQLLSSSANPFYLNKLEAGCRQNTAAVDSSCEDKKTLVPVSRNPEYV
ncbi:hypothetical protein CAPTEDRAFT_206255 [Capitella teleta]|uniref:Rho-GAP domain-containing protein n=1 Tax=Capitella teleta TaxID=283909 RepID=R7U1H1_CAPTE|nr:hypothetical protein CAPTEDRAFT_206255 [Capitella teleta]|eukprot:ELU00074.1 hypothetical protein CAPTEDRAFT_206255 [Capitella teleta]